MTPLKVVYDSFFNQITDDMYLEISEEETKRDCFGLLLGSLPLFEFPKKIIRLTKDEFGETSFSRDLTLEEINILATGMLIIWLQRQITSVELTRQKYTGADFKMTSQASHLSKLMALLSATKDEHRRLQMLDSRREIDENNEEYVSTFYKLVKRMSPSYPYKRQILK